MTASVMRMLEMKSIDVEGRRDGGRENGWTCLMIAAENGHLDICRLLIDKGAQVTAKNRGGWTPLHCAARKGHVEIVCLLCDHGADVEARTINGRRPLHYAAYLGRISVVKELIEERNADVNARFFGGTTALGWARNKSQPEMTAFLISHGGI